MLLRFLSCHKLRTALQNAYFRSEFTANLVGRFIHEVGAQVNEKFPSMPQAKLSVNAFAEAEMFTNLSYEAPSCRRGSSLSSVEESGL
jgi:hypothetical protein